MSMYICEAVSSTLEEIYQALMINSELMEQGSVKIMHRYLILGDANIQAKFGFSSFLVRPVACIAFACEQRTDLTIEIYCRENLKACNK